MSALTPPSRGVVRATAPLVLALGMMVHESAAAVVPTVVGTPTVANPHTPANTMMFAVTVTVSGFANDADHNAVVGYRVNDATDCATATGWKWSHPERFKTSVTQTWTLYNFQPGTTYDYFVKVGPPGGPWNTACGTLGTTSLPTNLGNLNLNFGGAGGYASQYIVMDTGDCGQGSGVSPREYLIAVDVANHSIVWYLDVAAVSTLGGLSLAGWRYQAGNAPPNSNRFLATVDKGYLYQWGWDGSVVDSRDFSSACSGGAGDTGPCISHDAFKSDATGRTYVASSQQSGTAIGGGTAWDGFAACGAAQHDSRFVDDGYQRFDGAFSALSADAYLMTDYGYVPSVDSGPNPAGAGQCNSAYWSGQFDSAHGPIDWTHVNSIAALKPGADELIDLSFKEWDQILRINANTGALLWSLSPNAGYSTLGLGIAAGIAGPADFSDQHFVHSLDGYLYMLDNEGDDFGNARVLRLTLSGVPVNQATITKSWAIVDPVSNNAVPCPGLGSGMTVPGTAGASVLALCHDKYAIEELNDADGVTSSQPPLLLTLPAAGFCSAFGPGTRGGIKGWYRAFPITAIGEF